MDSYLLILRLFNFSSENEFKAIVEDEQKSFAKYSKYLYFGLRVFINKGKCFIHYCSIFIVIGAIDYDTLVYMCLCIIIKNASASLFIEYLDRLSNQNKIVII